VCRDSRDGDSDGSGPEEGREDMEDVEVQVIRAILEEQRMMLSPECLNHAEMVDVGTRYADCTLQSSNFDLGLAEKSIEHNFQNGVRIVSKAEPEQEDVGVPSPAPASAPTEMLAAMACMSTPMDAVRVDVRARQDRFQAAGACAALVEVRLSLLPLLPCCIYLTCPLTNVHHIILSFRF
jgi:hypothetical protein